MGRLEEYYADNSHPLISICPLLATTLTNLNSVCSTILYYKRPSKQSSPNIFSGTDPKRRIERTRFYNAEQNNLVQVDITNIRQTFRDHRCGSFGTYQCFAYHRHIANSAVLQRWRMKLYSIDSVPLQIHKLTLNTL